MTPIILYNPRPLNLLFPTRHEQNWVPNPNVQLFREHFHLDGPQMVKSSWMKMQLVISLSPTNLLLIPCLPFQNFVFIFNPFLSHTQFFAIKICTLYFLNIFQRFPSLSISPVTKVLQPLLSLTWSAVSGLLNGRSDYPNPLSALY